MAASCKPYSSSPSATLPNSCPPMQPTTKPGPEQQPNSSRSAASRGGSSPVLRNAAICWAHTAYPPHQPSTSTAGARGLRIPHSRIKGRSGHPSTGASGPSRPHTTNSGNSAGSRLPPQSFSPAAKPCAAAWGRASSRPLNASASAACTTGQGANRIWLDFCFISAPPLPYIGVNDPRMCVPRQTKGGGLA